MAPHILTQLIIIHLLIFGNCLKSNLPKYILAPVNRSSFYAELTPYPEIIIDILNEDQFAMYLSGNYLNIVASFVVDQSFRCCYTSNYQLEDIIRDLRKLPHSSVLSMYLSDDFETFYSVSISIHWHLDAKTCYNESMDMSLMVYFLSGNWKVKSTYVIKNKTVTFFYRGSIWEDEQFRLTTNINMAFFTRTPKFAPMEDNIKFFNKLINTTLLPFATQNQISNNSKWFISAFVLLLVIIAASLIFSKQGHSKTIRVQPI